MSGLYNLMFGFNPLAKTLLTVLNIDPRNVPRFRDCFLSIDGSTIIVYTRTGGGNREAYAEANEKLRQLPGFLHDTDDTLDCTYALFHFTVPDDIKERCKALAEQGYGIDPAKRWEEAIQSLTEEELNE